MSYEIITWGKRGKQEQKYSVQYTGDERKTKSASPKKQKCLLHEILMERMKKNWETI